MVPLRSWPRGSDQAPNKRVIVNFYGSHASKASARFGPVPSYWGINQVIVAGDISAATVGINAIAFIPISVTESIVLYKQELLASKIGVVSPGSIAMGVPAPSVMVHLKGQCPWPFVKNTMIDNSINLAMRHDKWIGIQLIKMAVVDPGRRTGSRKMHASIVGIRCDRSISEREARQPKRLRRA